MGGNKAGTVDERWPRATKIMTYQAANGPARICYRDLCPCLSSTGRVFALYNSLGCPRLAAPRSVATAAGPFPRGAATKGITGSAGFLRKAHDRAYRQYPHLARGKRRDDRRRRYDGAHYWSRRAAVRSISETPSGAWILGPAIFLGLNTIFPARSCVGVLW